MLSERKGGHQPHTTPRVPGRPAQHSRAACCSAALAASIINAVPSLNVLTLLFIIRLTNWLANHIALQQRFL